MGEGFPTSYSSFAVTADNRADGRVPSASKRDAQIQKNGSRKRRTSSPPLVPLQNDHLHGAKLAIPNTSHTKRSAKRKISFDNSGKSLTTKKSWESIAREFKKRWIFVIFFLGFSALLLFGILLPVSRSSAMNLRKASTATPQESTPLARASRFQARESFPIPMSEHHPNRFAQWAAALFGFGIGSSQPVILSAGIGDLEMPEFRAGDEEGMTEDTWPGTPPRVGDEVISGRRAGKRRTADEIEKDAKEHPSRQARRVKLAESLAEERRTRDLAMTKKNRLRNRIMERVVKTLKAGSTTLASASETSADGHILGTYEAGHPEEIDQDGAFVGLPAGVSS